MNAKTIQILGGATIVMALAAVWATRNDGGTSADERTGAYLYPGLVDKVNLVTSVSISTRDEAYTLEKQGDSWTFVEKGGYPVKFDRIREIINAIAFFEVLEPKTSRRELYSRLGVQDPGSEEDTPVETVVDPQAPGAPPESSGSTRVSLRDSSGQVLADVVIGKANLVTDRLADPSLYVRKAGDTQAFEVTGRVDVSGEATMWVDKDIFKLPRERVRRAVTVHPDGERLAVMKNERSETAFLVEEMPEGRELKYAGVTDQIASALTYMQFEDVKPVAEVDFDSPDTVVTEYETWDGLRVTVRMCPVGDKYYAKFDAAYDPELRLEPATVPPAPEDPEAPETAATPPPTEEPLMAEEAVRTEAEDLTKRLPQWAFEIPGYRATNLEKRVEDLIKPLPDVDVPEPEPVVPVEAPGGDGGGQ